MLRIFFTPEDIARVRVAGRPDPFWETIFSVFRFRAPGPASVFGPWRRSAARAARRADLQVLLPLVQHEYFPDFLTPAEGLRGLPRGIEALLATPAPRLHADMTRLAGLGGPVTPWMRQLSEGHPPALERLASAIDSHHRAVVAPVWPQALAVVEADRSRRARVLMEEGCEGLLSSFRPIMRWVPPVLEVNVAFQQSIHLNGRGLLLVPGYLSWETPDVLWDPSLPPVLVYPVGHDPSSRPGPRPGPLLGPLIGQTRTWLLESIGDGRSTTDLARRVGVSRASISEHTSVLREAGLIRTSRAGKSVLHTMTPLGVALLNGGFARAGSADRPGAGVDESG